jgi:hypothetical protein
MEDMMTRLLKLTAVAAAASAIVASATAEAATIPVPKPTVSVPRPAVPVTTVPLNSFSKPGVFAGRPATLQTTISKWQGPAGAGTQDTTLIYQNGKVVGAISSISQNPGTTAPKPSVTPPAPTPASHPTPSAPTTVSHPAPPPPPPPKPSTASKPTVSKPELFPAFTDQYKSVKGYYVNGQLHTGLGGPTGGNCTTTMAYQVPGSGSVSSNFTSGAIMVPAVLCYVKS